MAMRRPREAPGSGPHPRGRRRSQTPEPPVRRGVVGGGDPVDGRMPLCSNNSMKCEGRVLAVDYGEKNIGLACSDELGVTVRPLPSIPNQGRRNFFKRLQAMVEALDIRKIVLGMPWNMDGSSGDAMRRTQRLMEDLESYLRIPLIGVDERLSTEEAMEYWRTVSPGNQKRYRTVDSLAAALILERYLKGESA